MNKNKVLSDLSDALDKNDENDYVKLIIGEKTFSVLMTVRDNDFDESQDYPVVVTDICFHLEKE